MKAISSLSKISAPDVKKIVYVSYAIAALAVIMLGTFMFNVEALAPKFVWSLIGLLSALAVNFVLKQYAKTHGRDYFKVEQNNVNWMITGFVIATLLNGFFFIF